MDATQEVSQDANVEVEGHEVAKEPDLVGLDANEGQAKEDDCKGRFVFKEMLSDEDTAAPTYDQLERFGLFDVTICSDSLAQYRAKYPLPEEYTTKKIQDEEENVPPRPSPQHRHSIAISSLAPPSAFSPPLASPGLPAASNRLSPFALARRASRKNRPAQPRTKSTNDVLKEAAVPPLLSPESDSFSTSDRRSSMISIAPTTTTTATAEETPLASRASLDRDSTIRERRNVGGGGGAPRKLRKNPSTRPPLPVIRTDDDFLLRPSSEFRSRSPSPARPSSSSSPTTSRKQGWRSSLSHFVSPVSSPTSFQMPHELPLPRQPRSPSPIDSFPSAIRRESALPPVDRNNRPRNDSLSDSYFGDSENQQRLPNTTTLTSNSTTKRDRTRSQSAQIIPSPSSPVSTGNLWARALKLGRKGAGSRASSVASSSASTTSWDLVEGESSEKGTFEVLRNSRVSPVLSASRPMARRTSSEGGGGGTLSTSRNQVEGQIFEASTSSPNLSKISEHPESLDQRFNNDNTNPYRYLPTGSPPASMDSFHNAPSTTSVSQGGIHTPPFTANSSNTILAIDASSTPSTIAAARRVRSRSALSSTVGPPHSPIDENDLPLPSPPFSSRSRATSNASTTYRSTHSSSQDSIFSRDDEGEDRRASLADGDAGEETGATSVTETEGEDEEDEAEVLKRQVVIDSHQGVAV